MKRPTLLLLGIVAVAIAGYAGYGMLASDETRIRGLLDDAASSFNHTRLGGCLEAFDHDYQDPTTTPTLDRAMLTNVLRYLFLRRVDPKTKTFQLRVRIPTEDIAIQVGEGGEQAEARFTLDLEQQRQGAWQSEWQLRVTAQMHKVDGDWRIQRSSHETAAGKPPR
jgi:hypothetical protein